MLLYFRTIYLRLFIKFVDAYEPFIEIERRQNKFDMSPEEQQFWSKEYDWLLKKRDEAKKLFENQASE